MGSNPWEVDTPKMGNLGGDFGLVGFRRGPDTEGSKQKKMVTIESDILAGMPRMPPFPYDSTQIKICTIKLHTCAN